MAVPGRNPLGFCLDLDKADSAAREFGQIPEDMLEPHRMATADGPPKKQKPKSRLSDIEQSERFIETARELGVDKRGERFEEAFNRVARQKPPPPKSKPHA